MSSDVRGARHVPVLLGTTVALMEPAIDAVSRASEAPATVIDATLGAGGHSEAILTRFPGVRLIGLDRDPEALELATRRLAPFGDRFRAVHTVYDRIGELVPPESVAAVLFDLGVSSMQLDEDERGFAYSRDAPLDMRMDQSRGRTAADVLNEANEAELARLFRVYGEERLAQRYARAIVRERATHPLRRSGELVAVIDRATPAAARSAGHQSKRVFQALRIEVNGELDALDTAVPAALDAIAVGGRIIALSYHSLEDRIVKHRIAERTTTRAPRDLPVVPEALQPTFRMLSRGAPGASTDEVQENPRAASVRLRAAQRVRGNP